MSETKAVPAGVLRAVSDFLHKHREGGFSFSELVQFVIDTAPLVMADDD